MTTGALLAISVVLFGWAILSRSLSTHNLTGPLVFLVAGLALGNSRWGLVDVDVESATVHTLAELTLVLLLFADASKVPVMAARRDLPLTVRLLAVGLPLSIVGGLGLGLLLFPTLPLALVGLIASALAPTDAALSASVIEDERLPTGIRRVLNVESGLNDGVVTPVVTFCIASTAGLLGIAGQDHEAGFGALVQLAVGVAIGAGLAIVAERVMSLAHRLGWMEAGGRRLGTAALALLAFLVAEQVGGNPFVSAFVCGFVFGAVAGSGHAETVELTELAGGLLSLVVWFVFGAGFVLMAFEDVEPEQVLFAIASLTVVRMIPVAFALIGTGSGRATVAFIGWFGPRGLASIVFALLALEDLGDSDPRVLLAIRTIAITIVFSVVAHGVTARPLATRYLATPDARRARRVPRPASSPALSDADPRRVSPGSETSAWRTPRR